jgi:homoserine kinase type II
MEYLATMPATFQGYGEKTTGTKYDDYFLSRLPGILAAIDRGLALAPELQGLPRCPTFNDYHPGNLKWRDGHGVGLFDFDWTKLDYRLFDIAIGIVYFCTSWEDKDDGELRLDKAEIFLKAYQDEASRAEVPGPVTDGELAALPRMLAIAALYVVSWDIVAYYIDRDPNDDEYLFFLEHNVAFVDFIEAHLDELAAMAARVKSPAAPGVVRGEEA